ncbi:hypothetical protein SEUCBS139899_008725 [Sporothrix eucalyptigena]
MAAFRQPAWFQPIPDPDVPVPDDDGNGKPSPLPAPLPAPIARLRPPTGPEGVVVPELGPMLSSNNPYAKAVEVEVQRMVIRPPTPDFLQPTQLASSTAQPVATEGLTQVATLAQPTASAESPLTPAEGSSQTAAQSQTPQSEQPAPPQQLGTPEHVPRESIDVSSLLGPDLTPSATTTTTTGTRSSLVSNDTGSTAAPPTPTTENDDTETDGEEDVEGDTDDEENLAVPGFLIRDPEGDPPADNVGYDLAWADVPPPAALRDVADDVPEILREIIASSIESVQAQLAVQVTAQAEREAEEKRQRDEAEAKAKEAAKQKAEEERQKLLLQMEQQEKQVVVDKGKARDTATRHILEPEPLPPAVVKKSRRHFASRMLRHVHVLGGSSDKGESSAAGAAAAAEAAQAAAARLALQRAYEEAMLRRYEGTPASSSSKTAASSSKGSAEAMLNKYEAGTVGVGPSRTGMAAMQRAYEEPVLRSSANGQKVTKMNSTTPPDGALTVSPAVATEPGTAPIPTQRRAAMLLAMVRKDLEKKKAPVPPATIECISCFEDIPTKEAVKTVCHSYCLDCFQQLVTTALDNEAQFPPKCCLNEVPKKTVQKYATADLRRRYALKIDEFTTPVADRVYCPTPDCGVWVPPAHIAPAARIARCRNGHETCTACRQPAHGRGTANREACPEASAQDQRDQRLADELAREEGWRHCIQCAVLIEHRDACQHMTCRCGAEFCYVCGLVWRTCHCDMDDLARVKREADARRQQRSEREARERERVRRQEEAANAELAELRDALAQIAAFEQRERQRMRRVQQAQRARLQRLKEQREAVLRGEIEQKYARLKTVLEELNALQAQTAKTTRREERTSLRTEQTTSHEQALARQETARAEAAAAAAEMVGAAERHWQDDYRARLALEVQLEAQYTHALAGDLDPKDVVGAVRAIEAYQRTNDARLDAYCAWRDRELAHARFTAEEKRAVRDEEEAQLVRKHRRESRRVRASLTKKHTGERVWHCAVAAERIRLLAEMEIVEQGLGLAGSTSEADTNLLLLLDLEASGALGDDGPGEGPSAGRDDDTEMSHLYAVMLAEATGEVDEADLAAFGDSSDDEDGDDRESFYGLYGGGANDNNRNRNSGSGLGRAGNNGGVRDAYNWPLVAEDVD